MPSDHRYVGEIDRLFQEGTIVGLDEARSARRIVSSHDEPALSALVERHGPMVLGVCRRLLASPHDVDDAFQATFLILVRKARALRDRHRLGPWLHGVAYRVAVRAPVGRGTAAVPSSSQRHERKSTVRTRLPDRLVVREEQCCRRGRGNRSAPRATRVLSLCSSTWKARRRARRRGGSAGAKTPCAGRLARARAALRKRLVRRGVAPGLLPVAGPVARAGPGPDRSRRASRSTNRAGMATLLAGRAAPSATTVISASVASLARSVMRAMTVSKVASLATAFLAIAAGVVMLGLVRPGLSATRRSNKSRRWRLRANRGLRWRRLVIISSNCSW